MRNSTSKRHCPQCRAEVEAKEGHCLLGHRLALPSGMSVAALRAEVDRVFEEARSEFATSFSAAADAHVPAPPPPPAEAKTPPPPPPPLYTTAQRSVWRALEVEHSSSGEDPIAAFAPAPRMDWGPERSSRRKSRFRGPSGATA